MAGACSIICSRTVGLCACMDMVVMEIEIDSFWRHVHDALTSLYLYVSGLLSLL